MSSPSSRSPEGARSARDAHRIFASMASTLSQIYLQIVFGIRGQGNLIPVRHKDHLHRFIHEVIEHRRSKLLIANAMPDHIHLLVSCKPSIMISDLVRDVKSLSSSMMKDEGYVLPSFKWQTGFGVFSYGLSQVDDVYQYVANQEEHHRKRTFSEEYLLMLQKHEVEYELPYVFDEDQVILPLRGYEKLKTL
jgi:putative transposase